MANELVIKNGLFSKGPADVTGSLTATGSLMKLLSSAATGNLVLASASSAATDIAAKLGSSVADNTVDASTKLLSVRTGIGGSEVEQASIKKGGYIYGTSVNTYALLSANLAQLSYSLSGTTADIKLGQFSSTTGLSLRTNGTTFEGVSSRALTEGGQFGIKLGTTRKDVAISTTAEVLSIRTGIDDSEDVKVSVRKDKLIVNGGIQFTGVGNLLTFPDGTTQSTAGGGTPVTIGTPANGLSMATGQILTLASATASVPGAVTTSAQSLAGLKSFTQGLSVTTNTVEGWSQLWKDQSAVPVMRVADSGLVEVSGGKDDTPSNSATIHRPAGKNVMSSSDYFYKVYNDLVTPDSVVMVTLNSSPESSSGSNFWWVDLTSGMFQLNFRYVPDSNVSFSWFVIQNYPSGF